MVALNYQTPDVPLRLNRAFFRRDGRCGFVLKPAYMRRARSGLRSHGDIMPFFPRFVSPSPLPRAVPGDAAVAVAQTARVRTSSPARADESSRKSEVERLVVHDTVSSGDAVLSCAASVDDTGQVQLASDGGMPVSTPALIDIASSSGATDDAAPEHGAPAPSAARPSQHEAPPLPGWLAGTEAALLGSGTLSVGRNSRTFQRILRDSGRSSVVGIFGSRGHSRSQSLSAAVGRDGPTLPALLTSQPLRSTSTGPLATISETAEVPRVGAATCDTASTADPVSCVMAASCTDGKATSDGVAVRGSEGEITGAAVPAAAQGAVQSVVQPSVRAATPPSPGRTPRMLHPSSEAASPAGQPAAASVTPSKLHGRSPFRQLAAAWLRGSRPGPSPLRRPLSALVLRAVSEGGSVYASPLLVQPHLSPDPFTLRVHVRQMHATMSGACASCQLV